MARFVPALALACLIATASACSRGTMPGADLGPARDMSRDAAPSDGPTACTVDFQCSDRIACTVDHCVSGACTHDACTDCCADGLACVPGFGCRSAPTPCALDAECDDGIRCTLDRCRDATACEHLSQSELCADDQICLGAVGCIPAPPTVCTTAADCERGAVCVGEWSCQPEFGCQFVSLRDCADTEECTADSCDEARGGCVHDPRDADADAHADITCTTGDDCDDADADVFPGASELCNAIDDDCDGMVDEGCCTAGSCTTSCDTAGTRGCNPDGSPGACVPPAEICNGTDDDCDGAPDDGLPCALGSSSSCTTTCASTGTRACLPGCALDTCAPPAETCNGVDDNCNGAADEGFPCVAGSMAACTTSCGSTGVSVCSASCAAGACTAPAESCNGVDDDCDGSTDEGFACTAGSSIPCTTSCGSPGSRACLPGCTLDSCAPPTETCNGIDDNCNATCDEGFACCAGASQACTLHGFAFGTALCRSNCSGFDTSTCSNCGNSMRNAGEACDGPDLGGQTCASIGMGFGSGTLACAPGCVLNTAGCSRCGNGTREPAFGEQCDGTDIGSQTCNGLASRFQGGMLTCDSACRYSTAQCFDPSGTYVVSPGVSYYCVGGLVNFSFGTAVLTVAGSSATLLGRGYSAGGLNCSPSGTYSAATRSFDVTCTVPGDCDETYRVTGTFGSNDRWSGTLTATFTPTGGFGCLDCSTGSFPMNASR